MSEPALAERGASALAGGWARRRLPDIAILGLAAGSLLLWLPTLPGVTMDEAWVFHRVSEIAAGERPVAGMTFYTGALHQYLLWPVFSLFGYTVGALRGFVAVANLAALAMFMILAGRTFGGAVAGRRAGLLVATAPAFVAFGRFGVELTALGPLLVVGGLLGVRVAAERGRRWPLAAIAGGLLLGLAVWNHFLMIGVPTALGVALLALYRGRFLRHPATWVALGAFLVGWAPQLWLVLAGQRESWGGAGAGMAGAADAVLRVRILGELPHLPGVLEGFWDGALVYQRFCGPNRVPVIPYPALAAVVALGLRLRRGSSALRPARVDVLTVAVPAVVVAVTVVISPGLSARFFVLPVAFGGALLLARLAPAGRSGAVLVGLLACANLGYLGANYYYDYRQTGGVASVYPLGAQLIESSTTFVDTRRLYDELVAADFDLVLANETISGPLGVHDWGRDALEERYWRLATAPPEQLGDTEARVAIVYHAGPLSWNRATEVFDVSDLDVIESGGVPWRRDSDFDTHFAVFVRAPLPPGSEAP